MDLTPEMLARAEAALHALNARYLSWAEADLVRLKAALAGFLDGQDDAARRLYAVAHDMKGQAATFGYPLVTTLGQHLCRLLDANEATPDSAARLVSAIAEVLEHRLEGDGGSRGRELLAEVGL